MQAEFDQEQSKQQPKQATAVTPKLTSQPVAPKPQTEACPICSARVATADIEAHVEQHFEDDAGVGGKGKPGQPADKKEPAKTPGIFSKWFGKEEEKKVEATPTPAPKASSDSSTQSHGTSGNTNSSSAVHSSNTPASLAYPPYMSQRGFYPGMVPGQYPRNMPQGYFPTGYPTQQQRLPSGMGQQYLYYPTLDQPPQ